MAPHDIETKEIGFSVKKVPLLAWLIGKKEGASEIIHFYGGFHGDEPEGIDLALQLKDYLMHHREEFPGKFLIVVPVVNPDGYQLKIRVNANGVDLNRNFPTKDWAPKSSEKKYFPGKRAGSEPEVCAIMKLIGNLPPQKIISFHSLIPHQLNFDGPGRLLAEAMAQCNHYPVTSHIGYSTPGSLGAYAGTERNIAVVTYELPEKISPQNAWKESLEAIRMAIHF